MATEVTKKSVVDIIMAEHRVVDQLFFEFKNTEDNKLKNEKLHMIIKELSQHAAKEEMVVYPLMKTKLPNGEALVQHALTEHQEVKEMLYKLDKMTVGTDREVDTLLAQCISNVQTHVREEEADLLPTLQQHCTQEELIAAGAKYVAAAAAAPSRPHPMAPAEPVAVAMMANAGAKAMDAVRDLSRPELMTGKAEPNPMVNKTSDGVKGQPAFPNAEIMARNQ
jgi:hemerythrin superfamily protein